MFSSIKNLFKYRSFRIGLCVVILILSASLLLTPETVSVFNPDPVVYPPYGDIVPEVLDGMSMQPIEGAEVIVVETNKRYSTLSDGKTPVIRVPILEDEHFKDILKKPWGEITLIIHKEGYADYVLFHTQIWENERRQGPRILLFKADEQAAERPFVIVEGPQRLWVNELIKKFIP
ncbi:MAG: hypothetical protein ACOYU3_01575 [Bacillota bacterium]